MNIKQIKEFSKMTKDVAERILREEKIEETLAKHGNVFVGGSYALDLMYGPDIDIVVECNDPRKASLRALNEFIDNRGFQKYEYGDFVEHSREDRPRGYIVNLLKRVEGRKWELEIWFFEIPRTGEKEHVEETLSKLTPQTREAILLIKHQREKLGVSKHKLSSKRIYDEVFINGATSISDIKL